jgi:homoprotocatechuate degradation regulator HpaR
MAMPPVIVSVMSGDPRGGGGGLCYPCAMSMDSPPAQSRVRLRAFSRSLPMALLRTREAVMRHFRPGLRAVDLTEQQWRVLRALSSVVEIEATRLAGATFLLGPSLTRILRDLEGRALIARRSAPGDQRTALLSLSPAGHALIGEAGQRSEAVYRRLTARIGEARLDAMMRLLAEVEAELAALPVEAAVHENEQPTVPAGP